MTSTVTVQAFENGKPIGEYIAHSSTLTEQQMVDNMMSRVKDGIGLRFLGMDGVIEPSICKLPAISY